NDLPKMWLDPGKENIALFGVLARVLDGHGQRFLVLCDFRRVVFTLQGWQVVLQTVVQFDVFSDTFGEILDGILIVSLHRQRRGNQAEAGQSLIQLRHSHSRPHVPMGSASPMPKGRYGGAHWIGRRADLHAFEEARSGNGKAGETLDFQFLVAANQMALARWLKDPDGS